MSWHWSRFIPPAEEPLWKERLAVWGEERIVISQYVDETEARVSVYGLKRSEALAIQKRWKGEFRKTVIPKPHAFILRLGKRLVVQSKKPRTKNGLWIPPEMAFGTGDHPTTEMILREMARIQRWDLHTVLDVGTGTGILALAARRWGSLKVAGVDFDPIAIRTAKRNELRNFSASKIQWKVGGVESLKTREHSIVVANLYGELLRKNAKQLAASIAPGGKLLVSGIFRGDEGPIQKAFERQKLIMRRLRSSGKWSMMVWEKGLNLKRSPSHVR